MAQKQYKHPIVEVIWKDLDKMHFSWDDALSYNKVWNFAVGERESGKSVNSWVKLYNAFYYCGDPSILLRRRQVDITPAYLDDIATLLNKFLKPQFQIQLLYRRGDIGSGIADIWVGEAGKSYTWRDYEGLPLFFRVMALSVPMARLKSMVLENVRYMFMDEIIINTRAGEKYLEGDEHFLIKEIYTTYNREAKRPIKILGAANPYSVYCPIFSGLKVESGKLKPGAFVVGKNYVIDCFQTPPELKAWILAHNPMYEFDDSYRRYAFGGESINDKNIRLHKTEPKGFKLKWVFKLGQDFISIHKGKSDRSFKEPFKYWVCKHESDWVKKVSKRRKIMVFNYQDLIEGAVKWMSGQYDELSLIREAMSRREIVFNCVDASYMLEDIEAYL